MIGFVFRLVTAVLSIAVVLFAVGIGFLWYDGSRILDRANTSGWLTPKPDDTPMTVFEDTASKYMFGRTWNETGFPCRTGARFWFHHTGKPDRRGFSISQVVARDISYEVEASQSLRSQVRQLSVSCLLEGRASDTELLRLWLRRASFGPGLTGLDVASQAIFNKAPSLLDQVESAKLVALIYEPGLRSQLADWESRGNIIAQAAVAN
jgi:hypothetical protein